MSDDKIDRLFQKLSPKEREDLSNIAKTFVLPRGVIPTPPKQPLQTENVIDVHTLLQILSMLRREGWTIEPPPRPKES
jgi:hypothetical protein